MLPKVITILGAPRSGSSALSRMLEALGVYFGESADLLGASEHNRYGFYEFEQVMELNERLIGQQQPYRVQDLLHDLEFSERDHFVHDYTQWIGASRPLKIDEDIGQEIDEQIRGVVRLLEAGSSIPALKDARLSITLPVWSSYIRPVPIILWRHPSQVAASLKKMLGLPEDVGEQVWLNYTYSAFLSCLHLDPLVISHETLVKAPGTAVQDLYSYLSRFTEIDHANLQKAMDCFDARAVHQSEVREPANPNSKVMLDWLKGETQGSALPVIEPSPGSSMYPFLMATRNLYRRYRLMNEDIDRIRRLPGFGLARRVYRFVTRGRKG